MDPQKPHVDLVYDPARTARDASILLAFDIEDDWESELEEFCRLKRLGRIKEAKKHFQSRLRPVSTTPYIMVQYAEMLLSCGDFKNLQRLDPLPDVFLGPPEENAAEDRNRGKLVDNYILLHLLSQRPIPDYLSTAWSDVRQTLKDTSNEWLFGSTEIQLIVLCLRILHYLETWAVRDITNPAIADARRLFHWDQLYKHLLNNQCIWDFKDLFLASVSVLGWDDTKHLFFGTVSHTQALEIILRDWNAEYFDEASVMGLLDLFTSLVLQSHDNSMRERNAWLIRHAKALADSVEQNSPGLMKSRPFIQWLLARTVHELGAAPERQSRAPAEDFEGILLRQGDGIHLPIYVPARRGKKPDWKAFVFRSTPNQRRVVEVAIKAAEHIGDYALQVEAMKLLILLSQDPRQLMSDLASLQLTTQGDREGCLSTSLSRYLVVTNPTEEADLLNDLKLPGEKGGMLFEQCENASLTWAWVMIRSLLRSSTHRRAENRGTVHSNYWAAKDGKGFLLFRDWPPRTGSEKSRECSEDDSEEE
ncbi:hypothetical protein VTH82DRAFT_2617 [Thermothelomyces myriococcoides]